MPPIGFFVLSEKIDAIPNLFLPLSGPHEAVLATRHGLCVCTAASWLTGRTLLYSQLRALYSRVLLFAPLLLDSATKERSCFSHGCQGHVSCLPSTSPRLFSTYQSSMDKTSTDSSVWAMLPLCQASHGVAQPGALMRIFVCLTPPPRAPALCYPGIDSTIAKWGFCYGQNPKRLLLHKGVVYFLLQKSLHRNSSD